MAKNFKVVKKGGSVPAQAGATGSFKYVVEEGQTEEGYRKLLDATDKRFKEAEKDFVSTTTRRLTMLWDVGNDLVGFFATCKNARGQISDKFLGALVEDLAPLSTGVRVTKEIIRTGLRLREAYKRERVEELAKSGISENHVAVFLQLDDSQTRKQLEDKAVKENLSGDQCRKVVRELAKDPAKAQYLKANTRSRMKQEVSKKEKGRKTRAENPSRMIEYIRGKFEADSDDVADLFSALKLVEKLEPADQSALVEPLDELITRLGELAGTYGKLKDAAVGAHVHAKLALKKEGATQGVKGAEAKREPSHAAKAAVKEAGKNGKGKR